MIEMHGNSIATVEYNFGVMDVEDKLHTEEVHTSLLAFYSHAIEEVEILKCEFKLFMTIIYLL